MTWIGTRTVVLVVLAALACGLPAAAASPAAARPGQLEGALTVVWGDSFDWRGPAHAERFFLHLEGGSVREVILAPELVAAHGGAERLQRRRVRVEVEPMAVAKAGGAVVARSLEVRAEANAPAAAKAVTGSQPWVSLLCKFADVSAEPKPLSYFQNMYASSWPGLDHYWRQLSYDTVNVAGSTAIAWVTLPHPRSHYETAGGGNLDAMVSDCTAAADSAVYFPAFVGINLMFNSTFGPYAWGGGRYLSLDGQWRFYRVTWEPPWGYQNVAVIAHEMGHGFGLPHSNNADGDSDPYDNPWDVMSNSWSWAVSDSTYGTVGKGTIAEHLDRLGWIAPQHKLVLQGQGVSSAAVDHLALSTTSNLRMLRVPIPASSRSYTVEVRDRSGYDGNLPGFAVVIHEVDPSRKEDAWLVDADNPSNGADEGAMWRTGECFEDSANQISVCVGSVTAEGFEVVIGSGTSSWLFVDGFEGGNIGAWSGSAD